MDNYLISRADDQPIIDAFNRGLTRTENATLDSTKAQKLQKAEEKKAELVRKDNANLDPGSYTQLENGSMEPNKNKIWNSISDDDIQGVFGILNSQYQVEHKKDGTKVVKNVDGTETPYNGDTRRIYWGPSKTDPNVVKLGLSIGDITAEDLVGTPYEGKDPSFVRYDPVAAKALHLKKYGWESGPDGIDPEKMSSIEVPWAAATTFEALIHGRENSLKNRAEPVYGDKGRERFGSGQSEYYKGGLEGVFGDIGSDTKLDYKKVEDTFNQYLGAVQQSNLRKGIANKSVYDSYEGLTPEQYKYLNETLPKEQYENMTFLDKVGNLGKAGIYGVSKSIMDIVDAVAEGGGKVAGAAVGLVDKDLGKKIDAWEGLYKEGEADKKAKSISGYSSYNADKRLDQAMNDYREATKDVSLWDSGSWKNIKWDKVGDALLEVVQAPELIPVSLGYMAAPGAIGKLAGAAGKGLLSEKGLKAAKEANDLRVEARAATDADKQWAATQRLAEKVKEIPLSDRTKTWLTTSGVTAGTLGGAMNNEQLDAYIKENGGEEATIIRALGGWLANSLAATLDYAALGKITSGGTANIADVMRATDKSTALKLVQGAGIATLEAAKGGLIEAPQEFIQSYVEAYNKVYGTIAKDENGNVIYENGEPKRVGAFEALEMSRDDAVVGSMAGLSMGAAMGAGKVGIEAVSGIRGVTSNKAGTTGTKTTTSSVTQPAAGQEAGEELSPSVQYFRTLAEVDRDFKSGMITRDNALDYIDKLESMQELRYGLKDAPEGLVAYQDARYSNIANHINTFLTDEKATDEQLRLQKKLPTSLPNPSTLGSENVGEVVDGKEEYTDADRKADAERLIHFAVDSLEFTPEQADIIGSRYVRFAKANGVELERLNTIVKNYAAVEEEASIGKRGWVSYGNKLDALMSASKPNFTAIQRQYRQLNNWLATTSNAKLDLEEGIAAAEQVASDKNKQKVQLGKGTVAVPTQYKKLGGKPFEINVMFNSATQKWEADTTQARKLVELKEHNAEEITGVLNKYNSKASQVIGDIATVGTLVVPEEGVGSKADISRARALDKGHVNSALSRINNVFGTAVGVNKVILDTQKRKGEQPHSAKWNSNYEYYRFNRPLINKGEYQEGDVVLLNAMGSVTHSKSKRSISSLYLQDSAAAKELGKAIEARATVLLDRDYVAGTSTWYKNKEGKSVLKEKAGSLNSKGQQVQKYLESKGYVQVPGNPAVFVAKEGNESVLEEAEQAIKAKIAASTALTKDKNKLVTLSMKLDWLADQRELAEDQAGIDAVDKVVEKTRAEFAELQAKLAPGFGAESLDKFTHMANAEEAVEQKDESLVEDVEFDGEVEQVEEQVEELDKALGATAMDTSPATAEQKMAKYIARRKRELVNSGKGSDNEPSVSLDNEEVKWHGSPDKDLVGYFKRKNVTEFAELSKEVKEVLDNWKKHVSEGLRGEELNKAISMDMERLLVLEAATGNINISESLLELSMGNGKPEVYETVVNVTGKDRNGKYTVNKGTKVLLSFSIGKADELKAKYGTVKDGYTGAIVGDGLERLSYVTTRKVELDPNTYLTVGNNPTLLSKFSVGVFEAIEDASSKVLKVMEKILPAPSDLEKGDANKFKTVDREDPSKLYSYNSPARSILFNSQGRLSPQVAGAMHLALADMIVTDKSKLTKGYKDDEAIAAMFGVSSSNAVTKRMRVLANSHGALRKTVANSLGKSILATLGIKAKKGDDAYKGMYEALVSDLGNTALLVAEELKLVESTEVESSAIGDLRKGGDVNSGEYSGEEVTKFVNLATGVDERTISDKVKYYEEEYLKYVSDIPGITTLKVGPEFTAFRESEVDSQVKAVRNDGTRNLSIAPEAEEALRGMINTEFEVDTRLVAELLDVYDNNGDGIKRQLGWLPLDGDEFKRLSYAKKEVQEAINRGVEKSFESLRELVKAKDAGRSEEEVGKEFSVWFKHFYATNGRYMIDSNTVNPQTDKLHRFLVQPLSFKVTHKVSGQGGERTFEVTKNGKTYDTSLYTRFALAQAFGFDIDKKSPAETVGFGNLLLSLDEGQVKQIKKAVLEDKGLEGKAEVVVSVNGVGYKLKADHLSHTLQALNFLLDAFSGEVTSSLTAEFDAITSGFGNKLQQMPILGESVNGFDEAIMNQHFARTGVVAAEMVNGDKSQFFGKVGSTIIGGINSMLGEDSSFKDSYQNLAVTVGVALENIKGTLGIGTGKDAQPGIKNARAAFWKNNGNGITIGGGNVVDSRHAVAEAIFDLLPKIGVDGKVSKELRTLFKDPFMVFNYAAGIKTIRENLSESVVLEFFEKLAANDAETLNAFVKMGVTIKGKDGKEVDITDKNKSQLVTFARDNPFNSSDLKIRGITAATALNTVVDKLFGEAVEDTFRKNFGVFIEVQEATNDAFRLGFYRFETMFNEEFKKVSSKGYVTEEEEKAIIGKLWNEFPWIMGPLSTKEDNTDVIAVYGKAAITDNLRAGRASPSSRVKDKDGKVRSVGVNTIMHKLVAAASAGAVIPFHFIDGAEMAKMYNGFNQTLAGETKGVLTIHDAKMGPIHHTGELGWFYNKGFHEVGSKYNLLERIKEMTTRWTNSSFTISEGSMVKGLKISGETMVPMEYNKAVKAVQDKVAELVERNNKAREEYSSKNDKVSTAYIYQHMIGTPDQIYIPGQDSYNGNAVMEYYKGLYKTTDDVEVKATVVKSISNEDAKEDTKKAVLSSYRAMSASNKALAAFLDQVIDINVMLGNC